MIDLTPFCGKDYPHPFTQGDYTYATNLHVLVRVPKREDVPINADIPVWDLAKTFIRADLAKYKPLETGESYVFGGEREWKVGVAWFQELYLDKLTKLPNLEVSPAGQLEPMPFRFTGGVGLLMPMKPPIKKAA
jgi:hypothetical protein